jgi:non-ribosomal peptide synthase protein (TIGR01720 family)
LADGRLTILPASALDARDLLQVCDGSTQLAAAHAAAEARLDPAHGIMLQAVWLESAPEPGRLLLLIHHLAVDGVSWRVLIPDLEAAWRAVGAGRTPALDPTGTSFRRWATLLQAEAHAPARVAELPLWEAMLSAQGPGAALDRTRDVIASARLLSLTLPAAITAPLLTRVPARFHAQINDVLLCALALALAAWPRRRSAADAPVIDLEGHGRQELSGAELSRTVGWFTSLRPVRLDLGELDVREALAGGAAAGGAIKRIKEQLRQLPDHGLGFGLLRYLNADTRSVLAQYRCPELAFNYLGRFPRPAARDWAPAADSGMLGGGADRDMPLSHALTLNALVLDGPDGPELQASWTWAGALFDETEIAALSALWRRALEALVAHVTNASAGGFTPSDVSLVALDQRAIDHIERAFRAASSEDDDTSFGDELESGTI